MSKKKEIKMKAIRRTAKNAGNSLISIVNLPAKIWKFLKSVYEELKLVEWLTGKKTAAWTSAIITTAVLLSILLILIDLLLLKSRDLLFNNI